MAGRPWAAAARGAAVAAAGALAAVVLALLFARGDPALRGLPWRDAVGVGSDYRAYHAAARQLAAGVPLYDLAAQAAAQAALAPPELGPPGGVLPYNNPPGFAALLLPLAPLPLAAAYLAYVAVGGALLALAGWALLAFLPPPARPAAAALALAWWPSLALVFYGQSTLLALPGLALWGWATVRRRDALAGCGLALALLKPQLVWLAPLLLLAVAARAGGDAARAARRTLAAAALVSAPPLAVALAAGGPTVLTGYPAYLLHIGDVTAALPGIHPATFVCWRGLAVLALGPHHPAITPLWLAALAATVGLLAWLARWRGDLALAAAPLASVLASPYASVHDAAILLPVLAVSWALLAGPARRYLAAAAAAAYLLTNPLLLAALFPAPSTTPHAAPLFVAALALVFAALLVAGARDGAAPADVVGDGAPAGTTPATGAA